MAESVVSFVVQSLGDLLMQEAKFLYGVSEQVQRMQTELRGMQCFLKDADTRQEENESIRNWVSEIREVAYDAEDAIETFALKFASRRVGGGVQNVLKRYACIFTEVAKFHKVGSEIEDIKNRITNLTTSLQNYGIKAIKDAEGSSTSAYERQRTLRRSYSHVVEEDTVGLEEDVKELVEHLVNEEKHCRVVSVCGMGGSGKTTLAKKVYHHKDVRRYFDGFAWAYISQQCQTRDVLQGILIDLLSASREQREEIVKMRDDELPKKLYKVQQEKKCLVMLDDIWSIEAWESLRPAFPDGNAAVSKILLTTRNIEVASQADPRGFLHEPRCLNEAESWELFQKKAFASEHGPGLRNDTKAETLGREMVGQCAGLPLAIVVLGGLLSKKHTLNEWDMVHRNINSYSGVLEVLALSYHELPYQLKSCFLHLGHFPEDFEIPRKKLVQMWVAEGIVSPPARVQCGGGREESVEDVAERRLDELIERCMVQVGERGSTGRVKTCRLHDFMRDLCLSMAKQESFLNVIRLGSMASSSAPTPNVRRLAIYLGGDADEYFPFKHETTSRLRSLLFFYAEECGIRSWQKMEFMFNDFTLLRVLDLEGFRSVIGALPGAIGKLIHMRYLSLRNSSVTKLPSSLGNLRWLQTLDLTSDTGQQMSIQNVIWKMERLRHLYLPDGCRSDKLQLGSMSNLVTLTNFDIRWCVVKEPIESTNLRKLRISYLNSLKELEVVLKSPSATLDHLRSLSLNLNSVSTVDERDLRHLLSSCHHLCKLHLIGKIMRLPEYHLFPSNLTKLILDGSELAEDPMATLEKLTNLRILRLLWESFSGKQMVSSANGFPQLKSLFLEGLHGFEEWRVDEGAMPNLYGLRIYGCTALKMVPDGLRFVTTLQELEIIQMSEAFTNRLRMVNGGGGEDLSKVEHVPSIIIK